MSLADILGLNIRRLIMNKKAVIICFIAMLVLIIFILFNHKIRKNDSIMIDDRTIDIERVTEIQDDIEEFEEDVMVEDENGRKYNINTGEYYIE